MPIIYCILLMLICLACKKEATTQVANEFGQPVKVEVNGYQGNIMEPFLSRDETILLFNNLNEPSENTNLHWASKVNDTVFTYRGEITGVNTVDLEGVPTLDNSGRLYFVSTRSYVSTLSTLYTCDFSNGVVANVKLMDGISRLEASWVNFDVEVSADGQWLYFVDGKLNQSGVIEISDIVIAKRNGQDFQRLSNSADLMKNINTNNLEYAACISQDGLQLYFTRVQMPITNSPIFEILLSTRQNINEPFGVGEKIQSISGFVEAPTISSDNRRLYYHKKENNKFVLYLVRKK